jgi:hypothetical protein
MASSGNAVWGRPWRRSFVLAGLLGLLFVLAAVGVWLATPASATPEARAALTSDETVLVDASRWLAFRPASGEPRAGLVFYPGGRVDPAAYAPLARAVAAAGYQVVIVPMPFNLAVLDADAAAGVIAAYPEVTRWAVGGHSLGGSMAARFARGHTGLVKGLALWAAYPDGADGLADSGLAVVSIYGTRDGVATPAEIEASRPLLPADTDWTPIEGGNHAQFGLYGAQAGDGEPQVSATEQQARTVAATVDLLQRLEVRR